MNINIVDAWNDFSPNSKIKEATDLKVILTGLELQQFIDETFKKYVSQHNVSVCEPVGEALPTRKACFFSLKDGKYVTENGKEITTDMLTKHPHQITDVWSFILLD